MNTKFGHRFVVALALVSLCLFCGACATKGEKKKEQSAPAASVSAQAVRDSFVQRVQAKDIEGLMALLTPDFTHNHFGSRDDIHGILSEALREGFLEGVSVNLANSTDSIGEDGFGVIGPIEVLGLFGHIHFTLYCKEIEKQWYIHKVIVDV